MSISVLVEQPVLVIIMVSVIQHLEIVPATLEWSKMASVMFVRLRKLEEIALFMLAHLEV